MKLPTVRVDNFPVSLSTRPGLTEVILRRLMTAPLQQPRIGYQREGGR